MSKVETVVSQVDEVDQVSREVDEDQDLVSRARTLDWFDWVGIEKMVLDPNQTRALVESIAADPDEPWSGRYVILEFHADGSVDAGHCWSYTYALYDVASTEYEKPGSTLLAFPTPAMTGEVFNEYLAPMLQRGELSCEITYYRQTREVWWMEFRLTVPDGYEPDEDESYEDGLVLTIDKRGWWVTEGGEPPLGW